jgi:hypothetical protein
MYRTGAYQYADELPAADDPEAVLRFWASDSMKLQLPHLAAVVPSIMAQPASSGTIERDFGMAADLLTRKRSMMDVAFAEVQLFLRANIDRLPGPETVPVLPRCDGGASKHPSLPSRLTNMEAVRAAIALSAQDVLSEGSDDDGMEELRNAIGLDDVLDSEEGL